MSIFQDKTVLLGVTGSIAAYKAAELASRLTQEGALVDTILTASAERFVTPLTFQSVTGRKAYTDADLWGGEGHVTHIGLGRAGDLLLVAPASANTLAKLAAGIADNLLCVAALAARCPLLIAPAMDGGMYDHPATQANIQTLVQRGISFVGPASGHLASGLQGVGRLEETAVILGAARKLLGRNGSLAGRTLVVTAGGTREAIDPVRVITNLSSGKQGVALAQAAVDRGANVILVTSAPLSAPFGCREVRVESAEEMHQAVLEALPEADGLIMAAAVADFRPARVSAEKIKKEAGWSELALEPTVDILKQVGARRADLPRLKAVVGFAAESTDLLNHARQKLRGKNLDLIVANDISEQESGFGSDTNRVTLLRPDGSADALPLMPKEAVADSVLDQVAALLPH